jgi:hypothetical protein
VKPRALCISVSLCLFMMAIGANVSSAGEIQPLEPEWLRQMYAEGWQKIQEGVLQRDTGGKNFETFAYGFEGLTWVERDYEKQVTAREEEYNRSPTKSLSDLIGHFKGEIVRLSKALETAPSTKRLDSKTLQECPPYFGGEATASPQAEAIGPEATARAYFSNSCGYRGDTFAMASAHAIDGTVETTFTQADPRNGGYQLESTASASASGSKDCESRAQASVIVSDLSIYYQTPYRQNFGCSYSTSIYTLDSTTWNQTGTGNLGTLTLSGTGYTLIDGTYRPIGYANQQSGISFSRSGSAKLIGPARDTVSGFARASFIAFELLGRVTDTPTFGSSVLVGVSSTTGYNWGAQIRVNGGGSLASPPPLAAVVFVGSSFTDSSQVHEAPGGLDSRTRVRWTWTEDDQGSSTGTGQWWMFGNRPLDTWQKWGASKPNLRRPIGHTSTRMRVRNGPDGVPDDVGFDLLDVRVTIGTK